MLQFINSMVKKGIDPANTLYINFEDPRWGELSLKFLQRIWETYLERLNPSGDPIMLLDEAHLVTGWERFVRSMHELGKASIIVAGSSSKLLSQ